MGTTDPSSFEELDALFNAVLDLPDQEREAYIEQNCSDTQLQQRIRTLLRASQDSEGFLNDYALEQKDSYLNTAFSLLQSTEESGSVPHRIPGYKLLQNISENTNASVYLVERYDEEWQHNAVLKLLKRNLDTDDNRRRFLMERQLMAELQHPNIATLLDAGTSEDGLPYFVTEYIDGHSITRHCQEEQLPIRERLLLFRQVLDAVCHAHRSMVIHRDIKPSNVLVSETGVVKLIDFGIAKLLEDDHLDAINVKTQTQDSLLTPAYSAPEQLLSETITSSTDVYQLGLLLFELLNGNNAYSGTKNTIERLTAQRDQPIPRLYSDTKNTSYSAKQLSGDLDTICRKALSFEPENRYQTAQGLLDDIDHYLNKRPITARPPTVPYILSKFLNRKPWVAPVVAVCLLAVVSVFVAQNHYLNIAREEATRANEIKTILVDMLRAPNANLALVSGKGHDITVFELLEHMSGRIERELSHRPALQAELFSVLGDMYGDMEYRDQAKALFAKAIILQEQELGPYAEQTLATRTTEISFRTDEQLDEELGGHIDDLIKDIETHLGDNHILLAEALKTKAFYLDISVSSTEAAEVIKDSIAILRTAGDEYEISLGEALGISSTINLNHIDPDLALSHAQEQVDMYRHVFGEGHIRLAKAEINLGGALALVQRTAEAVPYYLSALTTLRTLLGEDHRETISTKNNLALRYMSLGRNEDAERLFRECIATREQDPERWQGLLNDIYQNLAVLLVDMDRLDEAEEMFAKAKASYLSNKSIQHHRVALPDLSLASLYLKQAKHQQAYQAAQNAMSVLTEIFPDGNLMTLAGQCRMAKALYGMGNQQDGEALMSKANSFMATLDYVPQKIANECSTNLATLASSNPDNS